MNATSISKRIAIFASTVWYGLARLDIPYILALFVALVAGLLHVVWAIFRSAIAAAFLISFGGVLFLAWYDYDLLRQIVTNAGRYDANAVHTALTVLFWVSIVAGMLRVSLHDIGVFLRRWTDHVFRDRRNV